MVYLIQIPEKPYVKGAIEFVVDSAGAVIPERSIYGILECLTDSLNCSFSVDSSAAVTIAQQAGLVP